MSWCSPTVQNVLVNLLWHSFFKAGLNEASRFFKYSAIPILIWGAMVWCVLEKFVSAVKPVILDRNYCKFFLSVWQGEDYLLSGMQFFSLIIVQCFCVCLD